MARFVAFGGFVLGLSLVGYAVFARETDEEKIHGVLGRIEKAVHVDGDSATNVLIRTGNLRRSFSEIFDKNVSYRIRELTNPSQGSESLVALAVRSSLSLSTLDVSFSRADIRIAKEGTATVDTVAKVRAFRGSEPYEEGDRSVHFQFSKSGGDWRVWSFSVEPKEP